MPSAFKNDDPPSNPLLPLSPQRDTATSSSRVAAIISGIGSAMAWVIGLPLPPPPPLCCRRSSVDTPPPMPLRCCLCCHTEAKLLSPPHCHSPARHGRHLRLHTAAAAALLPLQPLCCHLCCRAEATLLPPPRCRRAAHLLSFECSLLTCR
jgi:hypothetical protein